MSTVRKPNLFIVGAPKCGTTSMFDFLVQHVDVDYGLHKEPHFFNDDHQEYRHARKLEDYLSFFKTAGHGKYLIDASTNYIYSKNAIGNILEFNSDAKLIVMLRNPVDLVVSLHSHFLFKQSETIPDLEAAWNAGCLRDRAPDFVKKHPYPGHISYREAGLLAKNYKPIRSDVPESQLLTIFFDDIVADPQNVIKKVGEFLELDFGPNPEFVKSNRKQQVYSGKLNQLIFYPPPWLRAIKSTMKSILPKKILQKIDIRSLVSSKTKESKGISDRLRSEMTEYFRDDIVSLSGLTDRNLDSWL